MDELEKKLETLTPEQTERLIEGIDIADIEQINSEGIKNRVLSAMLAGRNKGENMTSNNMTQNKRFRVLMLIAAALMLVLLMTITVFTVLRWVDERSHYTNQSGNATDEFMIRDNILLGYNGSSSRIVIPSGVTSISSGAFVENLTAKSLHIPASVQSIEGSALTPLLALEEVTIEEGSNLTLERNCILDGDTLMCVYGIENFREYIIPDGIKKIGERCFAHLLSVRSIALPDSVTEIEYEAFLDCRHLRTVVMPKVEVIGERAFADCVWLEEADLGSALVSIGDEAFAKCEKLYTLQLPESLKSIGHGAMDYTVGRIIYEGDLLGFNKIDISYDSFPWCYPQIRMLKADLGQNEYYDEATGLLFIDLPDGGCEVRGWKEYLTDIAIPDHSPTGEPVVRVGLFKGEHYLESVTIPATVREIADGAFINFNRLTEVIYLGDPSDLSIGENAFRYTMVEGVTTKP